MTDSFITEIATTDDVLQPMPYVCCAAHQTYGVTAVPGGVHDDAPGAMTTDPVSVGIRTVATVFSTARYHWRLSDDMFVESTEFTGELRSFYMLMATQNCPASVLVSLADAVLANSILYAGFSTAPTIVYETFRINDRRAVHAVPYADLVHANANRFADPGWQNLFIGSAGSSNYGHWLVDDLPRLNAAFALMRISPRPIRVLIHSYGEQIDQVRLQSIRLVLGEAVHIDLVERDQPYRFDELFYMTPVSQHPIQKSPVAVDMMVRQVLCSALKNLENTDSPTLLFVDRSSVHGRNLVNGADIKDLVQRRGFTVVDPETMPFVDQVRLFAGAQVVIGQMGAAMTNTLFCRPGTTLIYLAPSGWMEPFYWDLSAVRGQYYRVLFGSVTDTTVSPHCSDFAIDPNVLEEAINAL